MPLVSIVMPAYNVAQYIGSSIESVVNQTEGNWELIIVNDGSTDQTGTVIENWAVRDARIKVYTQENAGVAAARNKGLALASGHYISFLDADDIYAPTYIEKMSNALQQQGLNFAFCMFKKVEGMAVLSETPKLTFQYQNFPHYLLAVKRHAYAAMATMFDREFLVQNQLQFTEGCILGEDSEFVMKASSLGESVFIPEYLYFYVYRDNSASHQSITYQHIFDHYNSYERAKQFILNKRDSCYKDLYQKHIESSQNGVLNNLRRKIWSDIQNGNFDSALEALERYGKPLKNKSNNCIKAVGNYFKLRVINSRNFETWSKYRRNRKD